MLFYLPYSFLDTALEAHSALPLLRKTQGAQASFSDRQHSCIYTRREREGIRGTHKDNRLLHFQLNIQVMYI